MFPHQEDKPKKSDLKDTKEIKEAKEAKDIKSSKLGKIMKTEEKTIPRSHTEKKLEPVLDKKTSNLKKIIGVKVFLYRTPIKKSKMMRRKFLLIINSELLEIEM